MSRLLQTRWLTLLVRVVLGSVFIYSAWSKIADPPGFSEMIWNYQLLPGPLVNPLAIVLPWLELLAGIALVSGLLRKGGALLIGTMLVVFIAALAADLARGIAVDCGCFAVAVQAKTRAQMLAGMKLDLARDAGLLLLAAQVLFSKVANPQELPGMQRN